MQASSAGGDNGGSQRHEGIEQAQVAWLAEMTESNGRRDSEGAQNPDRGQGFEANVSFYTITDKRFFIGTVGMINSLRLMGHEQRVVVLDRGLSERQRSLLATESEIVTLPDAQATNPTLFKPYANLLHPRGVVVMMDSDLILAHGLDAVLEAAKNGRICACADPESGRWFAEWERIFGLPGQPRRQPYVNAGFVAFSVEHWPHLLRRWWDSCQRIRTHPTIYEGAVWEGPTSQADQDGLNAILMSEVPAESLYVLPAETQPIMEMLSGQVELPDGGGLSCSLRGRPVTLVHVTGKTKPWEIKGWSWLGRHPYPTLLRRLLVRRDARIRVSRSNVPIWFWPGKTGEATMRVLSVVNRISARIRAWPPLRRAYESLRGRLRSLRE